MSLANEGTDQDATLIVSVTQAGDVQLSYRPVREILTRRVPITSTADVPKLIAHLAGNLVRDESRALIAELQPPPPIQAAPTPDTSDDPPYLHDAWIFSVLGGLATLNLVDDPPEYALLTLQQSKRFDRFEIGLGVRFGIGRMLITAVPAEPTSQGAVGSSLDGYQFTVPVSVEYRVLGSREAYLQLGGALGLRIAGLFGGNPLWFERPHGGDIHLMFGLQATVGFRLAEHHGLLLRIGWDVWPQGVELPRSDGPVMCAPLPVGVQLGWQIGW